jgi:hypothetical protein
MTVHTGTGEQRKEFTGQQNNLLLAFQAVPHIPAVIPVDSAETTA